jgi:hypothetical protein
MSCNECHDPCAATPVDAENESLQSQLDNFILNFYGEITKTVVDGEVVWILPCDLSGEIPGYERDPEMGTACYQLSVLTSLAAQVAAIGSFGTMAQQNADAVDITGGTITGLSLPVDGTDAATKNYVDAAYTAGTGLLQSGLQFYVNPTQSLTALTVDSLTVTNPITGSIAGNATTATAFQTARTINGVSFDGTVNITVAAAAGTLTGATLASNVLASSLTSVGIGTLATMALQAANNVSISGGTITGATVTGLSSPTLDSDAATKLYVDSLSAGITPRTGVRVATTANITLSGAQTIDGVSVVAGNRVLVKNQSAPEENGIYDCAAGAWSRSSDANTAGELAFGYYYFVSEGTSNGATSWFIQTEPTVLGTDPVVFSQFSASQSYSAGTGLDLTGNTFSLQSALSGLTITGSAFNGTIGATTPSTGLFTTLTASTSIVAGNLILKTDQLNEVATNGLAAVNINYDGYSGGTTQFRNLNVYDGKNALVATFTGSTKSLQVFGGVNGTAIGATSASTAAFTTLTASGATTFTGVTDSSSPTTGAVVVSGGMGIAKSVYIGNRLKANQTTEAVADGVVSLNELPGNVTLNAAGASSVRGLVAGVTISGTQGTSASQFAARSNMILAGTAGTVAASTSFYAMTRLENAMNLTAGTGFLSGLQFTGAGNITDFVHFTAAGYDIFSSTGKVTGNHTGYYCANLGALATGTVHTGFSCADITKGSGNAYAFRGQVALGGNKYNLYMDGTANNFMSGSLGVGSTALLYDAKISALVNSLSGTTVYGVYVNGNAAVTATSEVAGFVSDLGTVGAAGPLSHYTTFQRSFHGTVSEQNGFKVSSTLTGATNNYGFRGSISAGTGRWNLYMDGTARNYLRGGLGIGAVPLSDVKLYLSVDSFSEGGSTLYASYASGTVASAYSTGAIMYQSSPATAGAVSTLKHFSANQGVFGGAVTTQIGFHAQSSLTGAVNNYGFYGDIAASSGRWNLYMAGTAPNYLAGELWVGTSTDLGAYQLQVAGNSIVQGDSTVGAGTTSSTRSIIINGGTNPNTGSYLDFQRGSSSASKIGVDGPITGNSLTDLALWANIGNSINLYVNGSSTRVARFSTSGLELATALSVANGGTGAVNAADARTNLGVTETGGDTTYAHRANNLADLADASVARANLGLGTIATQDANNVVITGGTASLSVLTVTGSGSAPWVSVLHTSGVTGSFGSQFNSSLIGVGTISNHDFAFYRNNTQVASFGSSGFSVTPVTRLVSGMLLGSNGLNFYESSADVATLQIGSGGPFLSLRSVSGTPALEAPGGLLGLGASGVASVTVSATGASVTGTLAVSGTATVGANFTTNASRMKHVKVVTATYTLDTTTADEVLIANHASVAFTITLLAASGNTNRSITIKNKGAANVTIDATGLGQIDGANSVVLSQYDCIKLVSDGSTWNDIS